MSHDSHIPANQLHADLLDGFAVSIPAIDWNDPKFNILYDANNPVWNHVKRLGIEELTDGTIGGTGIFDGLMVAVEAHLKQEYKANRITGADYTKAYTELMQAAMANAVQYATASEQQFWASVAARVAAIQGIVELENVKYKYELLKIEAQKGQAEYTVTKQKLATEDVNYAIAGYNLSSILPAQYQGYLLDNAGKVIANDTATYNLSTILPTQHAGMVIENNTATYRLATMLPTEHAGMVIANNTASYRLNTMLPTEHAGMVIDNNTASYRLDTMLPTEHAGMVIANNTASYNLSNILPATWNGLLLDNARKGIDNNIASYNLSNILPATWNGLLLDNAGKQIANDTASYNLATILPTTYAGMVIANDTASFNLSNILPVQEILLNEQGNVQRAQTLHSRRNLDGSTQALDSKSPINMQAYLNYVQSWAHIRSGYINAAKVNTEGFAVNKTVLEDQIGIPASFSEGGVDAAMNLLKTKMSEQVNQEWGNI